MLVCMGIAAVAALVKMVVACCCCAVVSVRSVVRKLIRCCMPLPRVGPVGAAEEEEPELWANAKDPANAITNTDRESVFFMGVKVPLLVRTPNHGCELLAGC
jgi:hypothetical protein